MTTTYYSSAGLFTTALRWVAGWTYFSAFWRRIVLENKLDPEQAGYIGEKFNHFLPNALGIKPLIEYLVSNPESLWWAMLVFTLVEAVVGLFFILGLFTRLMSVAVIGLAMGILLGAGWLGTTCLDEWQIGVLGIAAGFTIFLSGGGKYSLDYYFLSKNKAFTTTKWFAYLGSGNLPINPKKLERCTLLIALSITGLTLFTNQYFHGGVYGELHNMSVRPKVEINHVKLAENQLSFEVYRVEGADVYGSFLIGIQLLDEQQNVVFEQNQQQLSELTPQQIKNDYVAKVKTGKHSLILPLGAKATLHFTIPEHENLKGKFTLLLTDISGIQWQETLLIQ